MAGLNDSKKRDFITQFIAVIANNAELLIAKGYDPAAKLAELNAGLTGLTQAEAAQAKAAADAKDATLAAQNSLSEAYTNTSAALDLITGVLGKHHNLVIELKKMRKRTGSSGSGSTEA